jgi:multidrug efflux system membrane fusion protein
VTLSQIRPIQVAFSVPEKQLPEIRKYMANSKLPVTAIIPNDKEPPVSGVLSAVNNTVDNTTGTIQLLGDFVNSQDASGLGSSLTLFLT